MPHFTRSRWAAPAAIALVLATTQPAAANNLAENLAWQFMTPADIAAQAALRDLIERRRGGVYAAPSYTTNIARQYNCSIAATATGNNGVQSALANSPSVTGATSSATGNSNSTAIGRSTPAVTNGQSNAGAISSSIDGGTMATVNGVAWQALNSDQTNSGNQSASVRDANACAFGVLN